MENKGDSPSSSSPPSSSRTIATELKEKNTKFSGKPNLPFTTTNNQISDKLVNGDYCYKLEGI